MIAEEFVLLQLIQQLQIVKMKLILYRQKIENLLVELLDIQILMFKLQIVLIKEKLREMDQQEELQELLMEK